MTQAKFLERRIRRLERKYKAGTLVTGQLSELRNARLALRAWVAWEVNGNMAQGIIWRPKRDGGPYRPDVQ